MPRAFVRSTQSCTGARLPEEDASLSSPGMGRVAAIALFAVLVSTQARAAEGVLLGDQFRWEHSNVVKRTLVDVVAIPANAPHWSAEDWVQFAGWSAAIGTLMFAGDPVLDVQLDHWFHQNLDSAIPLVWSHPMQLVLWSSIALTGGGIWGWAWLTDNHGVAQGISLMAEALAVSQVYHVAFKLLIGREGPEDGQGNAEILGPAHSLALYPAGTPSGHAATLFSLMSAAFAYFGPPVLVQATGYVLVGGLLSLHVINHKHFLSDSLWGSAMGWYIGQWVVKNRASYRFGERKDQVVTVIPITDGRMNGLALTGSF